MDHTRYCFSRYCFSRYCFSRYCFHLNLNLYSLYALNSTNKCYLQSPLHKHPQFAIFQPPTRLFTWSLKLIKILLWNSCLRVSLPGGHDNCSQWKHGNVWQVWSVFDRHRTPRTLLHSWSERLPSRSHSTVYSNKWVFYSMKSLCMLNSWYIIIVQRGIGASLTIFSRVPFIIGRFFFRWHQGYYFWQCFFLLFSMNCWKNNWITNTLSICEIENKIVIV